MSTPTNHLAAHAGTEDRNKEANNQLVFSYKSLRNFIGFSGILLPFILMLLTKESNGKFVEPSISDYYYTKNGDILVVLLSVLAVFLFTYKGYGNWKERALTVIAAICAIGIAFSPTGSITDISETPKIEIDLNSVHTAVSYRGAPLHFLSACFFFIACAVISLKYFPLSDASKMREPDGKRTRKAKRNIVFKICGWVMLGSIATLILYFVLQEYANFETQLPIVFIFETVAIIAFGISWLTKGETFWPDGEHYMVTAIKEAKDALRPDASKADDKERKLKQENTSPGLTQ
jgi:hypothetical protein